MTNRGLFTHFWLIEGVREAALVSAPHPGGQFWVLHVGTQRHHAGTVANVDRRPVAGGQQQVDVVASRLSSHQVLGAAHHLEANITRRLETGHLGLWCGRRDAGVTLCGQSLDSLPAVSWAEGCGAVERPLCTRVYKETTEASSSLWHAGRRKQRQYRNTFPQKSRMKLTKTAFHAIFLPPPHPPHPPGGGARTRRVGFITWHLNSLRLTGTLRPCRILWLVFFTCDCNKKENAAAGGVLSDRHPPWWRRAGRSGRTGPVFLSARPRCDLPPAPASADRREWDAQTQTDPLRTKAGGSWYRNSFFSGHHTEMRVIHSAF